MVKFFRKQFRLIVSGVAIAAVGFIVCFIVYFTINQPQRGVIEYELYGVYEADIDKIIENNYYSLTETDADQFTSIAWSKKTEYLDRYPVKDFPCEAFIDYLPKDRYFVFSFGRALVNFEYRYEKKFMRWDMHVTDDVNAKIAFADVTFSEIYSKDTAYVYIIKNDINLYFPEMFEGPGHAFYVIKNGKKTFWTTNLLAYYGGWEDTIVR